MGYQTFRPNDIIHINNNIAFLRGEVAKECSRRGVPCSISGDFGTNKPIRATHVDELRQALNRIRYFNYTNYPLRPNIDVVRPVHTDEIWSILEQLEKSGQYDPQTTCSAGCVGLCASCAGTCNTGNQSAVPPGAPLPDNIAFDDRLPYYMRVYRNSWSWGNAGLPDGKAWSSHEQSYNVTFKKSGVWECRFHCDYIYEVRYNLSQTYVNEGMSPQQIAAIANCGLYGCPPEGDGYYHVVVSGVGQIQWGGDTGRDMTRITRAYIPAGVHNVIFQIAGNDGHSWSRDGLAVVNPYIRFTFVG